MLTEILMESLMSMDDETLDYVLESCSEEELEMTFQKEAIAWANS